MRGRSFFFACALTAIILMCGDAIAAQKKSKALAELTLYQGPDRQKILEEGARKEEKLIFYTSSVWAPPIVKAYQNKYPYIKVIIWRAGSSALVPRVLEEYGANKHLFDVIEITQAGNMILKSAGIAHLFHSPHLAAIEEGALNKSPIGGVFEAPFRTSGIGLGFNTKLIGKEQVPKTYQDLLDPKWKGRMAISGESTGANWMGTVLETYGEDFVRQLAKQDLQAHLVSGRALCDMVINGEYALSPTIFDSHVAESKAKGAPIDWIPLEPVHVNLGLIALPSHIPHPHAALLFIDFELSKEGAEINKAGGYNPMRKDVPPLLKAYKKFYGSKSVEQTKRWTELFNQLFLKK